MKRQQMLTSSTLTIKAEVAREELARRELARRHLVDFMEYTSPWYRASRHLRLVAEMLEQVELYLATQGEEGIGRLLISMPPQHGKTEMVSKHFPAWVLGRQPDTRIITTSYGSSLALENSRAARKIVMDELYMNVFGQRGTVDAPVELSSDSRSVEAWDLAAPNRGGLVAAGVGGGITGKPAYLFIIDDPFKNRKEAESETYRRDVWEWWTSSARTRLRPWGAAIGMFTRWHADDWAGRILRGMATNPRSERWHVLSLPAIWEAPRPPEGVDWEKYRYNELLNGVWVDQRDALGREGGDALWPEMYGAGVLETIRASVGSYDWEALYQQRPYSRAGNLFRLDWFVIVEQPPREVVSRVRYWDKASTAGGGAFSSGVCMSKGLDGLIYVEHVSRGQWSMHQREEEMLKTARLDREHRPGHIVFWHEQEPGSSGKDSAQATNAKLSGGGFEAHFETVTGSKEVRAGPWSSALEAGIVRLVRGGWNEVYIENHVAFPMGRFKDDVDASSGAYSKLDQSGEPFKGV